MITELAVGNFKAFGETQRVPLRPLTLVFGSNSSGKSSILQALLLLHHGMETGNYDVRQAKLAGDMVDLGGFANYVHRHDRSKSVQLCIETDIDQKGLVQQLEGDTEEVLPFLKLPQFGLTSRFGLILTLADRQPALVSIEALLNQEPLLTFSRSASGKFRARTSIGSEAYFSMLGRWMVELGRVVGSRRAALALLKEDRLSEAAEKPVSPEQARAQFSKEVLAEVRQRLAPGHSWNESESAQFNELFEKIIAEDEFLLENLILRDPGQATLRAWPVGRAQLAEGGYDLLGFFSEIRSWAIGDDGHRLASGSAIDQPKLVRPLWWVEAQAIRYNLSNLIEYCTKRITDALSRVAYLGPLRCVPSRYASLEGVVDAKALASGAGAWDEICRNPPAREAVNNWLGPERLHLPYALKSVSFLDADRVRVALSAREGNPESLVDRLADSPDSSIIVFEDVHARTTVSHRDIGFGVSQVLPVLINAAAMRERLIVIEQPELHLLPAQQAELGDVFIESALGERKNTFLLETHSEHLILRIMRRMRETCEGRLAPGAPPVKPQDVSVVYVERDGDQSIIREMPLTERGELAKAWPGGFFEEGYRELFS